MQTTIGASPLGRGRVSGYSGLGECDVLEVIWWIKRHYRIDDDHVYLRGMSMGGFGTWRMSAHFPDIFAAAVPNCGWADVPRAAQSLEPTDVHRPRRRGTGSCPLRTRASALPKCSGSARPWPTTDFPGVDHGVWTRALPLGYMKRMCAHTRDLEPTRVRINADHPRYASMYWASITRWDDPHGYARLEAEILPENTIGVNMVNVSRAVLTPPEKRLVPGRPIVWMVAGRRIDTPRSSDGSYTIVHQGDETEVLPGTVSAEGEGEGEGRPYVQGSYMNLYAGEPLLIVRGTTSSDTALASAVNAMAGKASKWLRPGVDMEFGSVPVKNDRAVTDADIARSNLLLIGGPAENALTRRIMASLPIREVLRR